jgi:osmotically-inducible protein OsmY
MKLSIIATLAVLASGPGALVATAQDAAATQAKPSDAQLSREIATKIANHKTLSTDAIRVNVENGVVTLTGRVGTEAERTRAVQLARETDGVRQVIDQLRVGG